MERTLAMIKPDAVERRLVGAIIAEIEKNDFQIIAIKTLRLTGAAAAQFYRAHLDKPFYESLLHYISSGQIYVLIIEKNDAVQSWRQLMGPTRPELAELGTLRRRFAIDIQRNSVHGADSPDTALDEIKFFFGEG